MSQTVSPEVARRHEWVDAAPFRALLAQLVTQTELHWRIVALAAGIPRPLAHSLIYGRAGRPIGRIRAVDAQALLACRADQLRRLMGQPADLELLAWAAGQLCRRASTRQVAQLLGRSSAWLRRLTTQADVWATMREQLLALASCEAWGIDLEEAQCLNEPALLAA